MKDQRFVVAWFSTDPLLFRDWAQIRYRVKNKFYDRLIPYHTLIYTLANQKACRLSSDILRYQVTDLIKSIIIHCTHYQHSDWSRAPAYFENSRDFVDKHDYSIIYYPITCADYTHNTPLAKEREHLNSFE